MIKNIQVIEAVYEIFIASLIHILISDEIVANILLSIEIVPPS
jgi:hypothetical protein